MNRPMFPFQKSFAKEFAEVTVGCLSAVISLTFRGLILAAAIKVLFFL